MHARPLPHILGVYINNVAVFFGGGRIGTSPFLLTFPTSTSEEEGQALLLTTSVSTSEEKERPSPHNVAVSISMSLQLTVRALEAVRLSWADVRLFCEPLGVHFREQALCLSRQQSQRGCAGAKLPDLLFGDTYLCV